MLDTQEGGFVLDSRIANTNTTELFVFQIRRRHCGMADRLAVLQSSHPFEPKFKWVELSIAEVELLE